MRRRDLPAKLLLSLATTLVLLLLLEAGFRFRAHLLNRGILSEAIDPPVDPPNEGDAELGHLIRLSANRRLIYELKPSLAVEYAGARVTLNRQGFRGPEDDPLPSLPSDPAVSRIVGIGDSFMFGLGVADDETYLAVLEAKLDGAGGGAEGRPSPRRWQVINTAVPGYNTVMEVETLRDKGLRYSPQLVIIEFVGNDLALPNFIRTREPVLATDRSFLVDYFAKRREKNRGRRLDRRLAQFGLVEAPANAELTGEFSDDPEAVPSEYRGHVGWDAYSAALAELRRLAAEHGFEVVWITTSHNKRPRRLARDLGFHVLSVGEVFRRHLEQEGRGGDYLGSPLARSATDGHPSALGHRIAGEAIYDFLLREDLLRPPATAPGAR